MNLEEINKKISNLEKAAWKRKYYKDNPEAVKKAQSKWYKENGKEYHKEYYSKNK